MRKYLGYGIDLAGRGLDADERVGSQPGHDDVGHRLDAKDAIGLHAFDATAHRAFGDTEIGRDLPVAAPGVDLQRGDDGQVHLIDGVARLCLGGGAGISAEQCPLRLVFQHVQRHAGVYGADTLDLGEHCAKQFCDVQTIPSQDGDDDVEPAGGHRNRDCLARSAATS